MNFIATVGTNRITDINWTGGSLGAMGRTSFSLVSPEWPVRSKLPAFLGIALIIVVGLWLNSLLGWRGIRPKGKIWEEIAREQLADYFFRQQKFFSETGKFDPELHRGVYFSNLKDFEFRFADTAPVEVRQRCPDCTFQSDSFKLAAYRDQDGKLLVFTIDSKNNFKTLE